MPEEKGKLYICATPIGNLEDITLRALRILREADYIAAEDTRVTRKLLNHYEIHAKLTSYHEHNEATKGGELVELMARGASVALVSDAGMPGISDPGHRLIVRCIEAGLDIEPIPGPSSLVTALVVSGLPTDSFVFQGFLPRKKGERTQLLTELMSQGRTVVIFESPRRLRATLVEIASIDAARDAAVARELTKRFEEVLRGTAEELAARFDGTTVKGEIVLMIGAQKEKRPQTWAVEQLRDAVVRRINEGIPKKLAILAVAQELGVRKRLVYESVMDIHE